MQHCFADFRQFPWRRGDSMQHRCNMTGAELTDWNKWAAIGQLAGAIASIAAVFTALYLAKRGERLFLAHIGHPRLCPPMPLAGSPSQLTQHACDLIDEFIHVKPDDARIR